MLESNYKNKGGANMNTGNRIKVLRLSKGLTQEELGVLLGVKKAAVQKYENGSVENMKRNTILKMANIFDVTPNYLIGWQDTDNEPILDVYNQLSATNREKIMELAQIFLEHQSKK